MDIRVGAGAAVGSPADKVALPGAFVEARVLSLRAPRKREEEPKGRQERRGRQTGPDPAGGKILVLMIADGAALPEGLESGLVRVFLRFARR
jgi:hypothetical protein